MSIYLKIILVLFGLAYLISPVDIIPELFLPFVGWIDDGFVLWTIVHLIRYGELPWFLFKKKSQRPQKPFNYKAKTDKSFSQATHKTEKKSFGPGTRPPVFRSAHEILGVSPHAGWKEIQLAYKEKIKQYHPDKFSHLGGEFSHIAREKFLEIQTAYETLKTKH